MLLRATENAVAGHMTRGPVVGPRSVATGAVTPKFILCPPKLCSAQKSLI